MSRRNPGQYEGLDEWERDVTRARELTLDLLLDGLSVDGKELMELIFIVLKYEDEDAELDILLREIAEEAYPHDSQGAAAISEFVEAAKKGARA